MDQGKSFPMPEEDFDHWLQYFLIENRLLRDT